MDSLRDYLSDEESVSDNQPLKVEQKKAAFSIPSLSLAPEISNHKIFQVDQLQQFHKPIVFDGFSVLKYNPKYEELFSPRAGPQNPFLTDQQRAPRNTLNGYVEHTNLNTFEFELQRRTFHSYGYADDPTHNQQKTILGDMESYSSKSGLNVFEKPKQPPEKRKKLKNDDPSDIDGYRGPWAPYEDEIRISRPTEEEKQELELILAKREKRTKVTEDKEEECKSILHIKDAYDYQGRSFLHIPHDVGVNLHSDNPPVRCFIPKRCIHEYRGHNKGVQKLALFPTSGHIFLSCSLDSKLKLWEFYGDRRLIRTYIGHKQAVRDCCFNNSGEAFLSASYDRTVKMWDTETGAVKGKYTCRKIPYCVVFNPDPGKQHFFLAGCSDKKIACFDTRSGSVVQEYDRHLGAINTISFVDRNRRIISTSDDKSIRVWEWDIPVDFKYIADPSMHSMPAVATSRNGKYMAFQSMDNQIKVMEPGANFRWKNRKVFRGHMVSGYACGLDFSPDMSYVISGDADGRLVVWDWKSTKLYERINAHNSVCMDVKWHWHETSKVLTAGWDGIVKLWD
ncbi:hypothetical protein GJ496_003964 [Pomphorhynchus laevis]|nr:hypothetical protein GJ496_003964 [Pomphorhynchus laevis]